ncbi:MAG: hypothetical protein RLO08_01935 [Parvibaculaceae bacterium]
MSFALEVVTVFLTRDLSRRVNGWGAKKDMIIFRLIGLIFIAAALMVLGADGIQTLEAGEVKIRSLGELWGLLHPASLDSANAWAAETLPGFLADPGFTSLLTFPSWAVLGVIGIVIAFLFRRRD